ncbi:hypothetical protein GA0116948_12315 [Chitinophaga costaii]|uniref:Lipocalin-like domain-containing protein n=1 Tax=Chitinophaga costaii TaxID=1335309 RepID=A0A1C4G5A5_9BACT|nr:hypothetical protein [Chitinophaga costaii]PUZ19692.1 hypothetical protein DCM91_20205 [Chitinophaga costaii]SCC63350.1 hypothetical protein GA0116948_12315 [Chitinophaga costaii]
MKKMLIGSVLALAAGLYAFTEAPHTLQGRWENVTSTKDGTYRFLAVFRADDTYDGFMNGKAFLTGKYHFQNDTLTLSDHICQEGYTGTYFVQFVTPDSLVFRLINDTCSIRREGTDGVTFKRLPVKP